MSEMLCTRCGSIGRPKRHTPGSFLIELLLFLLTIASLIVSPIYGFVAPVLFFLLFSIYGMWRLTARRRVCRICLAEALVPLDSPVGRSMTARKADITRPSLIREMSTPVRRSTVESDRYNDAAVSAAIEADGRTRFRVGIAAAVLGVLVLGIVIARANWASPPEPVVIVHGPDYNKPAPSTIPPAPSPQIATTPPAAMPDGSEDRALREDGRIYSVAFVTARVNDNFVGEKIFAQGRLETVDYASGMLSRPFAVIKDEQHSDKTLLCAMDAEEGAEVVRLYRRGEVVAVSGEYLATAALNSYLAMPILNGCRVAGPQDNVVRPLEVVPAAQLTSAMTQSDIPQSATVTQYDPTQLKIESGVRMLIHLVYINRQPDGSFSFLGKLLQPVTLAGGGSIGQGTKLTGSGTVNNGRAMVSLTGFTIGDATYVLQVATGANAQPGTGPGTELSAGKVLEMWLASVSVYERTN